MKKHRYRTFVRKYWKFLLGGLFSLSAFLYLSLQQQAPEPAPVYVQESSTGAAVLSSTAYEEESRKSDRPEKIYVHIHGAVLFPGVYALEKGARLQDVLTLAGGFAEGADTGYHNLAARLQDEQQIYIPLLSEEMPASKAESVQGRQKLNLNRASAEELMQLPGIGPAKAEQIIAYRQEKGDFKQIEDIMNIQGIKSAAFEKIKDDIYVE